ncbi:MAG: PAS domain-containing protein, partial [bacterium]|nr:PAS domain-containing protein [bacterium]
MEQRIDNAPENYAPTGFYSKPGLSFVLLVLIILTVSGIATYALNEIKSRKSEEIEGTLKTVLSTTHEALTVWADDHIDDLQYWASRPDVGEMVQDLLTVPKKKESLASSTYLRELRRTFQPVLEDHGHLGFYIVCPDYINISSLRDESLGSTNLLAGESDYLERLFKGENVMTTPFKTDVPLPGKGETLSLDEPTMFIGVPVFDAGEKVVAALLIRINPAENFSRIAKLGRIGETGETYIVDRAGLLISESRFDSQLVKAGLINEEERGMLKVSVRDPGVNLIEGGSSLLPREKQPLTFMAKSVTEGNSGANLKGYNDYRGVPVVGVWLWDDLFGLGMTTEIDFNEAFRDYHFTRNILMAVLFFTLLLFLVLYAFIMKSRGEALILKQEAEKLAAETNAANELLEFEVEERRVAQEELLHSQQALKKAQEIARLGTWEYDVVDNKIIWSDEVYRIFGVDIESFENTFEFFIELIHPDDREYVLSEIKASMESKKTFSIDYRIVQPGGDIRYVHEEAKDISDDRGNPLRRIGTVQDITERKEAEKEIESLAKFPSENPFPVMQISSKGKILYANEASRPILNVWGVEEDRLPSAMKTFIAGIYAEGKSWEVDVEQGMQTFSITFIPVNESDYVYAYGLDITARKNAEINLLEAKKTAESATKAKSEFLANMSHEIRTPMTSIIGMAELLSESELTDKEKDYVERLKGSGDALLSII